MKYKGMTVNERLYVSGYMDEFDKAVKEKDFQKVKLILEAIELNEESIKPILEQLSLKPKWNLFKNSVSNFILVKGTITVNFPY